jgi:hypothetical protein
MYRKLLLQLAQQFAPDFLTAAVPFDSVNNGCHAHYIFFCEPMKSVNLQINREKQWLIQSLP